MKTRMDTAPLRCQCEAFELNRPGSSGAVRIHINAFVGADDETETHTAGQCWLPEHEMSRDVTCQCGIYLVNPEPRYKLQAEYGIWRENEISSNYTFVQEVHRASKCSSYANGGYPRHSRKEVDCDQ